MPLLYLHLFADIFLFEIAIHSFWDESNGTADGQFSGGFDRGVMLDPARDAGFRAHPVGLRAVR